MKNRKLKNVLLIILPAAAVILTALPESVQMRFADPDGVYIEYCSGFSMLPVGYGNWSHMLAGILSGVVAVMAAVRCFRPSEKIDGWMRGMAGSAAALLMLASLLYKSLTPIGWAIAAVLVAQMLLISHLRR